MISNLLNTDNFKYAIIAMAGIVLIAFYWFPNRQYMQLQNKAIKVNNLTKDLLQKETGKYVNFQNVCLHEQYLIVEGGDKSREVFPIKKCTSRDSDSTFLFIEIKGGIHSIFRNHYVLSVEDELVLEGELIKSEGFESQESKILDEIGIRYSNENAYILRLGKTPKNTTNIFTLLCIFIPSLVLIICYLIRRQEIQKQKKMEMMLEIMNRKKRET